MSFSKACNSLARKVGKMSSIVLTFNNRLNIEIDQLNVNPILFSHGEEIDVKGLCLVQIIKYHNRANNTQ